MTVADYSGSEMPHMGLGKRELGRKLVSLSNAARTESDAISVHAYYLESGESKNPWDSLGNRIDGLSRGGSTHLTSYELTRVSQSLKRVGPRRGIPESRA
jgi:hypothetical protein